MLNLRHLVGGVAIASLLLSLGSCASEEKAANEQANNEKAVEITEAWKLSEITATDETEVSVDFGLASLDFAPTESERLLKVSWSVTAEVADPDAVSKIQAINDPSEDPEKLAALTGRYRILDMDDVDLIDTVGRYSALWVIEPEARRIVSDLGQAVTASEVSPGPWHWTSQISAKYDGPGRFLGLLEVGTKANVVALFRVPKDVDLGKLRLQIEDQEAQPVKVGG
jgi:hypothetical protein